MRSIRLSLVVYFLTLLTAALAVASAFAYRSSQRALEAKREALVKQVQAEHEERVREEQRRMDSDLENQAINLAGRLQIEFNWGRLGLDGGARLLQLHSLGAITAAFTPSGYLSAAPWLLQMRRGGGFSTPPLLFEMWRVYVADIALNESELALPARRNALAHFQIDTNHWSKAKPSQSLGDRRLPHPGNFGAGKLYHKEADDWTLASGQVVRRLRIKAARPRSVFIAPPRGGRGGPPPPPRPRYDPPLIIFVQVVADRSELDQRLASFREEGDQALEALAADGERTLRSLRNRLLAIGGLTFAATVLGTFALVWLGLRPLQRLSVAVSKVTPRDFQLPLDGTHMPAELRPIEDRLTETLAQLKRAFAREKQATADISHELRTPLAAMLTTIELALRKERSPAQYREFFTDCRASAQSMNQIVERLLTLARIDAGVDRLKPQAVDVDELAEQCATVVRPLAEARGLKIAVYHPDARPEEKQGPRLTTDPDKLREVLNNLLHNAIQYNRPDGRIDLTVARTNGKVELAVHDTGIGIPPQARELIFERFYRADPSRTGDGLNAGLGLAIVKEYVELMGGTVRVESQEGMGSTFRIQLPIEPPAKIVA